MKLIYEKKYENETTKAGGYVMFNGVHYISTIYCIDHSFANPKLINSKTRTFIYNNEEEAIAFANSYKKEYKEYCFC